MLEIRERITAEKCMAVKKTGATAIASQQFINKLGEVRDRKTETHLILRFIESKRCTT